MKHALIKNSIVENIIEVDNEALRPSIEAYEKSKAEHDKAMKVYEKELQKADEDMRIATVELAAFKLNNDEDGQESVKQKIRNIKEPKAPPRLKAPKGEYEVPEDYELMAINDMACDIGWLYNGKIFVNGVEENAEIK